MGERRTREQRLAADLESIAAALRDGEATLYGYRIEREPDGRTQRGGIACEGGWFAFEFDERSD